jgi:para-nitrobenzyl esterase
MPAFDNDIVFADGFPGWAHGVPVMLGCLENEARYFIRPEGVYTQETFANMAHALAGDKAGAVLALAAREGWTPYQALDKLFTAVVWTEPALETMRRFAKLDRPLYYYHFARLSPGAIRTDELVKHSSEIRYVFGNLTDDGYYDAKDDEISALMRQAWTSFARDGAPKSSNGQAWPRYDANDPHIAWIEDDMSVRPFPVTDMMRIINSLRRPNPDQTPANP